MRSIVAAFAALVACSSGGSGSGAKPKARCADVAACTAACAPCRTGHCAERDGRACMQLGKLHLRGQPPQFDLAAAASAYEAGCNGYAPACAALALQVQDGRGVPYDADKARTLYTRACDQGSGVGCFNVGVMYEGGVGVPHDPAKALELFERAETLYKAECAADPGWCPNLGYLYEGGLVGGKEDPARAARVYRDACDRGDHESCGNLGLLELDGRGVPPDREAALARLDRACKAGGTLPCGALAQALDPDHTGVAGSLALYERACDGGDQQSCAAAGARYMLGQGVPQDVVRGAALTERSCDLGSGRSCYLRGDDLRATEPARAAPFFERSCHIGMPDACMTYAVMIQSGALPGGPAEARAWVEAACRQGQPNACQILKGAPP